MNPSQNVLELSSEPRHKQTDGDATDCWLQQRSFFGPPSIRLTVSVSVLRNVVITSQVSVLHRLRWNCNYVLSGFSNKFSELYKISSVLTKIRWLFCGHSVHVRYYGSLFVRHTAQQSFAMMSRAPVPEKTRATPVTSFHHCFPLS